MMRRQAQEDLRKATIPPSAEAYEARLPADLKLPGGQQFKVDANDPSFIAARNLAHAKGWSQQDFSEALGIFASHIAGQEFQLAERSRAELGKIGSNAPQRVDAATKWLDGFLGAADAAPVKATLVTASHLKFVEAVMQALETQGVGRFSQSHRAAPEDAKIPGYDQMSFEQKRFIQDQRAAARRGRE
jgi:transcriptional regulator with XRE-family HTH domain